MLASVAASQNLNTIKDLLHSRASKCQENMRDYNFRWNITSVKGAFTLGVKDSSTKSPNTKVVI